MLLKLNNREIVFLDRENKLLEQALIMCYYYTHDECHEGRACNGGAVTTFNVLSAFAWRVVTVYRFNGIIWIIMSFYVFNDF